MTRKMNKQKLQENIEKVEAKLAATQSELERMKKELAKPVGQWAPKHAEDYWAVGQDGRVTSHTSLDDSYTRRQAEIGNCHKTRELATAALDRQKLKVKILNSIAELNDGWEPYWSNGSSPKFFIRITDSNCEGARAAIFWRQTSQHMTDQLYLKSKEDAEILLAQYTPEQLTAAYWP